MVIGVTGNTGTGKSLTCEFFEEWGARLISCDEIGKEVLKEPHIIKKIEEEFEETVERGEVNSEKLGSIVFTDRNKLAKLNKIVHPELLKRLKSNIENSNAEILVVDAALIFEWEIENWFDFIILVISSREIKFKRLKEQGISDAIIKGRLESQSNSKKLLEYADFVIENEGNIESLKKKAKKIWNHIKKSKGNS